jgi:hypothetical protein
VVCGVRVEDVADPPTRKPAHARQAVDGLATGKAMEKTLR